MTLIHSVLVPLLPFVLVKFFVGRAECGSQCSRLALLPSTPCPAQPPPCPTGCHPFSPVAPPIGAASAASVLPSSLPVTAHASARAPALYNRGHSPAISLHRNLPVPALPCKALPRRGAPCGCCRRGSCTETVGPLSQAVELGAFRSVDASKLGSVPGLTRRRPEQPSSSSPTATVVQGTCRFPRHPVSSLHTGRFQRH